ncbi:Importin-9 [Portunus trituberculatus]|uniref:Importin-9 n=1 Tax=Portunus trituberculatus TaxID=210409 RepID=A0A5B7DQT6_PORTR|nr:Importin-9 [Portunus trituberculatus]
MVFCDIVSGWWLRVGQQVGAMDINCREFDITSVFRVPVCPEHAKAKIRELLPHGLHEPISKVRSHVISFIKHSRSSVAYAISAIAHWDWPDQWCGLFDLLMAALKTGQEAPVHGAMRVLTEFSRDLTDQHIHQVAPVILPEMYRIFCEEEVSGEVLLAGLSGRNIGQEQQKM